MKNYLLGTVIALLIGISGCQKKSDLSAELSPQDIIAVEEMENAYEMAKLYSDSLIWCSDTNQYCNQALIHYCDSLYHHHSDEFDINHENYSHSNIDDDHHHSAISQHHHGDMQHHDEENGDHHGHSMESHYKMNELKELHTGYHPI